MSPQKASERNPILAGERGLTLCCQCIPIRLGVFLIAAFAVLTGVVSGFGKALGVDTSALFGGYTIQSKVLITFLELSGLVWGFMGMLGALRCSASFTNVFLYYQYVRMASWVGIFYYDLPALWGCELWLTDIASQEWNPRMYQVAMQGECYIRRVTFLVVACISMVLFGYFTTVNYVFHKMLEDGLQYTIENKQTNSSAFVAQSLVEKRPLIAHPFPTAHHDDEKFLAHAAEWVADPRLRPVQEPDTPGFMPRPMREPGSGFQGHGAGGPPGLWHSKHAPRAAVDAAEP